MGNIYCAFKILNPTPKTYPNDVIKGIFYVRSEEKKEQKLKSVEIQLVAEYEEYGEGTDGWAWEETDETLKKYQIAKDDKINPNQTKEYPFEIKLPPTWKPKQDRTHRNWCLELQFCQKTGMATTRGADKLEGTCVLPVDGSTIPASFH